MMLDKARHTVRTMLVASARFNEIENYIATLPVDTDEKSALWLLAWVHTTNPALRKQVTAEALATAS